MIYEPGKDDSSEGAAEGALWATLERRLERKGSYDALLQLRHLVGTDLEETEETGGFTTYRFGMYQRISDYSATYNAVSGEQKSWMFDLLRHGGDQRLDEAACRRIAEEVGRPPDDASLEVSGFERSGEEETVYIARWAHVHDGIRVEGDYIQVAVNPDSGRVFSHHRKWHDLDPEPTER